MSRLSTSNEGESVVQAQVHSAEPSDKSWYDRRADPALASSLPGHDS